MLYDFIIRVNKYSIIDYTTDINNYIKKYIISNNKYNTDNFDIKEYKFFIKMLNYMGYNYNNNNIKLNIIKNTFYHCILKSKLNKVMNKKDINKFINSLLDTIMNNTNNIKKICDENVLDINSVIKNFNIMNHPMSTLYNNYIDIFKKRQKKDFNKTNIKDIMILGNYIYEDCIRYGNMLLKGKGTKKNFILLVNLFTSMKFFYIHHKNKNNKCCSINNGKMCKNIGNKFNPKIIIDKLDNITLNDIMNKNIAFKNADSNIKKDFIAIFIQLFKYHNINISNMETIISINKKINKNTIKNIKNILDENTNYKLDKEFLKNMVKYNIITDKQFNNV